MIFDPIVIERLEEKARQKPIGRVPWSDHDRSIIEQYYGRGAVTFDDLRYEFDYKERTDRAIGIEASRLGVAGRRA